MKTCTKCKKEQPETNFSKASKSPDGLQYVCKDCARAYKKQSREQNSERDKQYRATRKEQTKTYDKAYVELHRETIRDRKRAYRQAHREQIKIRDAAYCKAHRELIGKSQSAYAKAHREQVQQIQKRWYKNHPEAQRARNQNYRSKKAELPHTLTISQWTRILAAFNNACCYCGEVKPLEQEHFLALTKGGEYSNNNIIPACRSCNGSKQNKDFFEWYPNFTSYSKEREKVILDFLN